MLAHKLGVRSGEAGDISKPKVSPPSPEPTMARIILVNELRKGQEVESRKQEQDPS